MNALKTHRSIFNFMQSATAIDGFPGWGHCIVNVAELNSVRTVWEQQVGEDEFRSEMDTVFAGIEGDLRNPKIDNLYLVIYERETPQAILELVDSSRGATTKLTKLLTLFPSPTYWADPTASMLGELYSTAILATIMIGSQKLTDGNYSDYEVKIYGRDQELLNVLRDINKNWQANGSVQVSMEGRWLTFYNNPREQD